MRSTAWTIQLVPAPGLPNEYEGTGERVDPNALGGIVNLKVGAVLSKGRMKAWLGPGIVICEGPFTPGRPVTGTCKVSLGEGAPGTFRAERSK